MANSRKEPDTAPQSGRWYNLTLGPSFTDDTPNKHCTLRYEFKPASIDKTKPGSLHKNKDNRVTVEFQNNQLGKPKVTFDGSSEDYRENDAVLFFDGQTFRLERLHRAVNQLRHRRQPGESAAAMAAAEPRLSPVGKGAKPMHVGRSSVPPVAVEVEKIDIGAPENPGGKAAVGKGIAEHPSELPNASTASPDPKGDEAEEHQDTLMYEMIFGEDPDEGKTDEQKGNAGFDIKASQQNDTDDEIANVDDCGDEAAKGPNAADALRAQVNAGERNGQTSSSSSSSGSGSGSSSSSSDSEGSDEDSINSI
ncbi:hypothetical protein SLE2022_097860 [Rubroshorea leprosula]